MTQTELPYATISYDAPIVFCIFKDGAELGAKEIKELIAVAEKFSWSKPYFTFSDVRVNISVKPDGKSYLSDFRNMPFFRGAAVLVQSSMMSFAINFISQFQSKKYPLKAFTEKKKALQWLGTLSLDSGLGSEWQLD
jgi:hypothetical protein